MSHDDSVYRADFSVLEQLNQPKRQDEPHRAATWEQARTRIESLPEPERRQQLQRLADVQAHDRPTISAVERQRRKQAVDAARASVRLSGFVLDEPAERLLARYIDGELTRDALNAEVLRLCGLPSKGD